MEALEKAIYNAAEGNAFGIPAPEKPARTFFRLNTSTCNEWFNRNRLALHLLALHCMELEMVIRSSTCALKDLLLHGKQNDPYFEQILLSLVWAFLRNFESDALYGVYTWTKTVTGRKLLWIKMAAEQAAGHREIAADGYKRVLEEEKLEPATYDFINDQMKICLMFSADYERLHDCLLEEKERNYTPQTIPITHFTCDQLRTFIQYDKTKDPSFLYDLTKWDTLEEGEEISNNFSVHKLLAQTEATLSFALVDNLMQKRVEKKDLSEDILRTLLQECFRTGSQEYLVHLTIMNHFSQV